MMESFREKKETVFRFGRENVGKRISSKFVARGFLPRESFFFFFFFFSFYDKINRAIPFRLDGFVRTGPDYTIEEIN